MNHCELTTCEDPDSFEKRDVVMRSWCVECFETWPIYHMCVANYRLCPKCTAELVTKKYGTQVRKEV